MRIMMNWGKWVYVGRIRTNRTPRSNPIWSDASEDNHVARTFWNELRNTVKFLKRAAVLFIWRKGIVIIITISSRKQI